MLRTRIVSLVGAVLLLTPLSYGGGSFGTVRGVTRNAEGAPLGGVQVVIHSLDEGADRTTLSDQRGAFLVENLDCQIGGLIGTRGVRARRGRAGSEGLARREFVKSPHRVGIQREVEDVEVLGDAIGIDRLRNDDDAMLNVPSQHDLCRRGADGGCDLGDDGIVETALLDRAVPFEDDAASVEFALS